MHAAGACAQVLRECKKPEWWPLDSWNKSILDRNWKSLEAVYHAIQEQRRLLLGSSATTHTSAAGWRGQ